MSPRSASSEAGIKSHHDFSKARQEGGLGTVPKGVAPA